MPHRRALALARFVRSHDTWWPEVSSGLGATAIALLSWAAREPLEQHAVLGHLARLVGGGAIEALGLAFGLAQLAAVAVDRPPWRWIVAIALCVWWSIPVFQALKGGVSAPMATGACLAWAVANLAAVWCLLRPPVHAGAAVPVPGRGAAG